MIDGKTIEVALEPERDEGLNGPVPEAFRARYGARSSGPTETMVNSEVSRATLRLGTA